MIDVVVRILQLLDRLEQPVFRYEDTQGWPAGLLDRLTAVGLLRETSSANWVRCTGCDEGHMLEPEIREYPKANRVVGVAKCPDCGRVEVELDRMRLWEPSFDGLAALLATELDPDAQHVTLAPGRIILLGSQATPGGMLDVFLARGLTWADAADVVPRTARLAASKAPAVLLPHLLPPADFWVPIRPHMLMVAERVRWDDKTSRPDFSGVSTAVHLFRPPVPDERWLTVTECAKQLMTVVSGLSVKKAQARVSFAASKSQFTTNGKDGLERRIDRDSFSTWLNEQRERDLAAGEKWAEG